MSRPLIGTVLLVAALAAAGCDESAPTAPTTPEVPVITESFAGTVTVNGAVTHPFVIGTPAAVQATLSNVSAGADAVVGFSLGTWNTDFETCTAIISNDNAVDGRTLVGSATTAGAFCVRVYDVGKLTAPTSYEITVLHR